MDTEKIIEYLRGRGLFGYEHFGAHFVWEDNCSQVRFTVYAPNAKNVCLIGDFSFWQPWQMHRLDCGVWTLVSPDPQEGQRYKYQITTQSGEVWDRADPFAFSSQLRPENASVITYLNHHIWQDSEWLSKRSKNFDRPLNIYELHLGSWKRKDGEDAECFYQYDEICDQLIPYLKEMGYTHIELLPLTEYPLDASWGYQVSGYFSATSRYGKPEQLMKLIDCCHQAGIGVIFDFVPTHFVRDFHALHLFDGSCMYEPDDENQRYSPWDTALFDFTKPHVISFLRSSLNFWISVYHADGIRYDAVANLIYRNGKKEDGLNDAGLWFLRSVNYDLWQEHPQVMLIAEDSSDYPKVTAPVVYGGLGFDYKWDLGWMHDTLDYLATPFGERSAMTNRFLFSMSYFYQNNHLLPLSHDEVVHGKKTIIDKLWGNYEQKFAQLRCLYLYLFFHPGKKLSFMGNELAEFLEWSEQREPGWNLLSYPAHQKFHQFLQKLHKLYLEFPCLWEQDYDSRYFRWLHMGPSIFVIQRSDYQQNILIVAINLSDKDAQCTLELDCGLVPILNTLDPEGKNICDVTVKSKYPYSDKITLSLTVPALSGVVLKPSELQKKNIKKKIS